MRTLTIKINTENAAFDGQDLEPELMRILNNLATKIDHCGIEHLNGLAIMDINGNKVGRCVIA
jgi:hypothetical protein